MKAENVYTVCKLYESLECVLFYCYAERIVVQFMHSTQGKRSSMLIAFLIILIIRFRGAYCLLYSILQGSHWTSKAVEFFQVSVGLKSQKKTNNYMKSLNLSFISWIPCTLQSL